MASLQGMRDSTGRFVTFTELGGYPVYYVSQDGQVFCADCASQEDAEPPIVACDVHWEGPSLFCDGCSAEIESAYGDPDA